MFTIKRWTLLLAIAATLLIIVATFRDGVLPIRPLFPTLPSFYESSKTCPASPPSERPEFAREGNFSWSEVRTMYPVAGLYQLPDGEALAVPTIQYYFAANRSGAAQKDRQGAVKKAFLRGWNSYRSSAWMHDELAPVSGGYRDTFGAWGATLVDSLDTLWIMGLHSRFIEAVTAASKISFSPDEADFNTVTVNMFETTIRYLGGFLAAYDLTDCKDERLLRKAIEVGDMIYASYDTHNRMPVTRWNIRKHGQVQFPAKNGILAELASASLEMTRLSQLTGDMKYYDAITRITRLLDEAQSTTQLPGMFPTDVQTLEQNFTTGTRFGFGAMADSAYEYFGKTWQLLGGRMPVYGKLYENSMNVASSHLLYRPSLPDQADVLVAATWHSDLDRRTSKVADIPHLDTEFQHLSCFAGGMYLLGGRLFGNESHVDIGRRLTHGCVWAYQNSPLGIMPEVLALKPCPSWEACEYSELQPRVFTSVRDTRYILRPEAIESVFYAYRISGDERYRDIAWGMFQNIEKHTRTKWGNAAIKDVMRGEYDVEHEDNAESFWFSETLKYFYLIFSEPELVSLDDWVFNTEAHPFRIPRGEPEPVREYNGW